MVLADTSVWAEHFAGSRKAKELSALLVREEVVTHPAIIGELSLGMFKDRRVRLTALRTLRQVVDLEDDDVLAFIEGHRLYGTGIGWMDAHLLASALRSGVSLWTLDRSLRAQAKRTGVEVWAGARGPGD